MVFERVNVTPAPAVPSPEAATVVGIVVIDDDVDDHAIPLPIPTFEEYPPFHSRRPSWTCRRKL